MKWEHPGQGPSRCIGPLTRPRAWPAPVVASLTGPAVVPTSRSGRTDGAWVGRAGTPTYGISGIPVDRDDVRAHGKDERTRVKDFEAGVKALALLLRDLASQVR